MISEWLTTAQTAARGGGTAGAQGVGKLFLRADVELLAADPAAREVLDACGHARICGVPGVAGDPAVSRRRFVPKHQQEQRRALRDAVRRGDVTTGKELTKKLLGLQQKLFGAAGEPDNGGRPFNDDIPF